MRLALLLVLGACTQQMAEDALAGPQRRCDEARAILAAMPEPTASERALVVAVCADLVI